MADTKTPSSEAKPTRQYRRELPPRAKVDPELTALYKRVGERLRDLWDMSGMSQREICVAIFGNPNKQGEWSRWTRGIVLPNIGTLYEIAKFFGTDLAGLGLYDPGESISVAELKAARRYLDRAMAIIDRAAA